MKVAATVLKQLLEKKTLLAKQFVHHISEYTNNKESIMEIVQTKEILTAYNNFVAIYMNPKNTQETRSHIQRIFATVDDMVSDSAEGTANIVSYVKMRSLPNAQLTLKAFFTVRHDQGAVRQEQLLSDIQQRHQARSTSEETTIETTQSSCLYRPRTPR